MTGKDVLPGKDLLEKTGTMKKFWYSPLGKELKTQTRVVEKQHQKLNKTFESYEEELVTIKKEEPATIKKKKLEIIHEPKLVYNNKYSFSEYRNVGKYMDDSPKSKYNRLAKFYNQLNEF